MKIPLKSSVLIAILLLSGLVSIPRLISFGPISSLAILTVIYAFAAWTLWFARPILTRSVLRAVWPLLVFMVWVVSSILWYKPTIEGTQNILVISAFVGLILLAASLSYRNHKFQLTVGKTLARATYIAAGIYVISIPLGGLGSDILISARTFAVFAALGVAWHLSNWRYGSRKSLWRAIAIAVVIGASISRMASAVTLLLFMASQMSLKNVWGWVRVSLWVALAVVVSYLALTYVEPLNEKFFTGDTKLHVGGTKINVSGREDFWRSTLDSYAESPWVGKGAGSAEELLAKLEAGQITHPHNDYLRILHDYGAIGLALWVLGFVSLLWATWKSWARAHRMGDPSIPLYLTAFLSLIVVAIAMITDNVMVYIVVMAPLGILVGTALGRKPG